MKAFASDIWNETHYKEIVHNEVFLFPHTLNTEIW